MGNREKFKMGWIFSITRMYTHASVVFRWADRPTDRVTYSVAYMGPKRSYANMLLLVKTQKLTCSFKIVLK